MLRQRTGADGLFDRRLAIAEVRQDVYENLCHRDAVGDECQDDNPRPVGLQCLRQQLNADDSQDDTGRGVKRQAQDPR
jgi:hypothetical protein